MRGSAPGGRFDIDYESASLYEGISDELGGTVGQYVHWWSWTTDAIVDAHAATIYDELYDVSDDSVVGNGRMWEKPFTLPTISAIITRGGSVMNERGFYVTDSLRITVNVDDVLRLIPNMLEDPQQHIKDRLVYDGEVYTPSAVLPTGSFGTRWAVVTIMCNRVNAEEMVNDPQFLQYASPTVIRARDILS